VYAASRFSHNLKAKEQTMKAKIWTSRIAFPAFIGVALAVAGCQDATTPEDVTDARQDVHEEKQETAEVMQEGREEIAEAQRDAAPYTVNKPVDSEDAAEARQDIAEAKQEASEETRDQLQEESEAVIELRTEEQRLAATQARDAFVQDIERALADAQIRIEQLEESASTAEGQAKETADREIAALESQHERVEEALEGLKAAELAHWQTHKENVRVAVRDFNSGLNGAR
jgi:hypothetical protein